MFITFERIKELAQKQGLSINSLEERMGYSRNTIYAIKRNQPGSEKLQQIADYFNVSTDYLLGRTDNPKIANSTISKEKIDFKKIAAESMSYDGKTLTDDDIDLIAAVLEQRFKNRD